MWDGRDNTGSVVADEAYSFKVDWTNGHASDSYFPANRVEPMTSVTAKYYDRHGGTLSYELPVPSRVHVQAGTATPNPRTKEMDGPVMKTIVNREPRGAGTIAEHWNGRDESGAIFIPDLPDFVTAIATTPLPANSVITFGNRQRTFLDVVLSRSGASLFGFPVSTHEHHAGLQTLDDVSPSLRLTPKNAHWSASERVWRVSDDRIDLDLAIVGASAKAFRAQPGVIYTFLNGKLVGTTDAGSKLFTL
jgi:hypothetical protein